MHRRIICRAINFLHVLHKAPTPASREMYLVFCVAVAATFFTAALYRFVPSTGSGSEIELKFAFFKRRVVALFILLVYY